MHHAERFLLVDGEGLRRADRVLDLPSVEIVLGEVGEVRLGEGHRGRALEDTHFLDEHLEDGLLGFCGELAVAEGNVDARLEGVIECLESELVGFSRNTFGGRMEEDIPRRGWWSGKGCPGSTPASGGRC